MSTQSKRIVRAYLLLFVLLAALSFLSLAVGSVHVSAADILAALGGKEGTDMTRHILFDIRLPRMLAALRAAFTVPLRPPDRLTCSTSFPASRKGVKYSTYSDTFT